MHTHAMLSLLMRTLRRVAIPINSDTPTHDQAMLPEQTNLVITRSRLSSARLNVNKTARFTGS